MILKFAVEDSLSSRRLDSHLAAYIKNTSEANPQKFEEACKSVVSDAEIIDLAYERKIILKPSAINALKAFNRIADDVNEMNEQFGMTHIVEIFKRKGYFDAYAGQTLVDEITLKVMAKAYQKTEDDFFCGSPDEIKALRAATAAHIS